MELGRKNVEDLIKLIEVGVSSLSVVLGLIYLFVGSGTKLISENLFRGARRVLMIMTIT